MNNTKPKFEDLQCRIRELEFELKERNGKRFKFLADNSIDCLWQLDTRLKFLYLSPSLYEIAGFKPEEWIGTYLWTHFKRREFIKVGRLAIKMLRQYKTFGYVTFTTKMLNKKNEEFPVEIISKPMVDEDGKLIGLQGSTREISERVEYQKKLEKLNEDLIQKNQELNKKLNEISEINSQLIIAKNKALESERLQSAFLANMSHEIRIPMNGIIGFIDLLKEPNLTADKRNKYHSIVKKSSERLLATINDIIDISRIQAGIINVNIKPVKPDSLLDNVFEFFLPEATEKNLSLKLEKKAEFSPKPFYSDEHLIHSILNNLIKNAIKFTPHGEIKIKYQYKENQLSFEVTDTGIGIPPERIDAIFNRFEKADIEDTNVFEGSGLGLAITKSYVELLNGEIRVHSNEGSGTSFMVSLPNLFYLNEGNISKHP